MEDLYARPQKNGSEAMTSFPDDDDLGSEHSLTTYEHSKEDIAWKTTQTERMIERPNQIKQSVARRKSSRRLEKHIKTLKIENAKLNSKVSHLEEQIGELKLKINEIQSSVSYTEDSKSYLEETKVLSEEIKLLKNKVEALTQQNVTLTKQLAETKTMRDEQWQRIQEETSLRNNKEGELNLWKQKYKDLQLKYEQLLEYYKEWIPPNEHIAFVQETQRLLDELRQKYQEEIEKLQSKIKNIESERKSIQEEGNKMKMKLSHLIVDKNNTDIAYAQLLQKCQKLMSQIQDNHHHEKELEALIQNLLYLAERTTKERDQTIRKSQIQQRNLTAQLMEKSLNVGRLQERLKEFREKIQDKANTAEERMQAKESNWKQLQNEYQREMHNLRISLLEKEQAFNDLHTKKSQLEQDLDILFKSVKNDNMNIQRKLHNI